MIVKTSELTGVALDWAVAATNLNGRTWEQCYYGRFRVGGNKLFLNSEVTFPYSPSTDGKIGSMIIEREGISVNYLITAEDPFRWSAKQKPTMRKVKPNSVYGPTLLIAAMRCYVASKLGNEVEVPEELI
jgi:hypothetical protein